MATNQKERKNLVDKADSALRDYLRWLLKDGVTFTCFICQKVAPKEYASVGHFRKRSNYSTRWLLKNNHLICLKCQDEGDPDNDLRYAQRLDEVYGEGTAELLTQLSHRQVNYHLHEIRDIIDSFQKLKEAGIR